MYWRYTMNEIRVSVWNVLRLVLVTGMVVMTALACDTGSGGGGGNGDTPGDDTPKVDLANYSFTYPIATLKEDGTIEAKPIWNEDPGDGVSFAISPSFGPDNNSILSFDKTDGTITGKMPDAGKITVYTITATGGNNSTTTGTFVDRFAFSAYTSSTAGIAISTVDDLKDITANEEYYLTDHIDLLGTAWTPLFDASNPFTGTLHGNGYVIYNLEITGGDDHYQGLFAALKDASIENLGIGVRNIEGGGAIGALAGYAEETSTLALSNIAVGAMSANAQIKSTAAVDIGGLTASYVGGVIGYLKAGTLENACNLVAVEGSSDHVGGLVGKNEGTATGYAMGAVSGARSVGGLVGYNNGGTATGYATGDVSGTGNNVGGLVGSNGGTATGYATGDVSGTEGVGGLVGLNTGTATGYATGAVSGTGWVGGLVGNNNGGTATGYATGDVSGVSDVGGLVGLNWGTGTATGYARGSVTRSSGTAITFGLLAGRVDAGSTVSGYHSGTAGESGIDDTIGATGEDGTEIDITTAQQDDFKPTFTFGTNVGEWIWTEGEWPAIRTTAAAP